MKRVLILCTGNSCRSQMAEVIWRQLGAGQWESVSAGSNPSGYVHPMAIESLKAAGMPHEGLTSKKSDHFENESFDLVVTVCDNAQAACPNWPNAAQTLHWPFEDPADATGTDAEKQQCFHSIRDQIKDKIQADLDR